MAKKNGGGNNYTPIKNTELLKGQPDNRTPQQQVADGKKPEAKKENENWVDQNKRTTPQVKQPFSERLKEIRGNSLHGKDISKQDPEKDK
jgi:hypothetical protein